MTGIRGGQTMGLSLDTKICKRFQITYPILQAGMAGGVTTPELVAAVSNAGGLGIIGAAYMTPEAIRTMIRKVKSLTDKPFGINLFKARMSLSDPSLNRMQERLDLYRKELSIPLKADQDLKVQLMYDDQFQVVLEEKVQVFTTVFGLPTSSEVAQLQSLGIKIISMITTVNEALQAEAAGVDAIVAQGGEAGGHRGTFEIATEYSDSKQGAIVGTMALVPQVVDQVNIPVIASGGIMDGRGVVAALALGAEAVQMGTCFLTAIESGAHPAYKEALLQSTEESTTITTHFSGRPARGVRNRFINEMEASSIPALAYPVQNVATGDIRAAANAIGDSQYMSLWAGQGTRLLTENKTTAQIMDEIIRQAHRIVVDN
jgi:nitronate monooxygenase